MGTRLEKTNQLREHVIADEIDEALKRWDERLEFQNFTLAEHYLKRNARLHFHFSIVGDDDGVLTKYCARFYLQRGRVLGEYESRSLQKLDQCLVAGLKNESDTACLPLAGIPGIVQDEPSMFVDPVEFMDSPQRVCGVPCASMMRLQLLDDCLSGRIDAANLAADLVRGHGALPKDRELGLFNFFGGHTAAESACRERLGQGHGEMIEGRSEAVDTIPGSKREVVGNASEICINNAATVARIRVGQLLVRGLRIWLIGDTFGFCTAPGGDLAIQPIEVILGPSEFEVE